MSGGSQEFFVGYHPRAPEGLARFLRRRIVAGIVVLAALAVILAASAPHSGGGRFEYGVNRRYTGRIIDRPYPMLAVRNEAGTGWQYYLLVGRGKHGAGAETAGLDGQAVTLEGALIERDGGTMLEVLGRPAAASSATMAELDPVIELGPVTVEGEIADAKCHLGVMVPGEGRTHRACAVRCISGGAPPLLLSRSGPTGTARYLLVDEAGGPVGARVLDKVAEPVRIQGRATRRGDLLYLAADPSAYERIP